MLPVSPYDARRLDSLATLADALREEIDAQFVAARMRGRWGVSRKSCEPSSGFYADHADYVDIWALRPWVRWLDSVADPLDWKDYPAAPAGSVGQAYCDVRHCVLPREEGGIVFGLSELDLQFTGPSDASFALSPHLLEIRIRRRADRSFEATVLTATWMAR